MSGLTFFNFWTHLQDFGFFEMREGKRLLVAPLTYSTFFEAFCTFPTVLFRNLLMYNVNFVKLTDLMRCGFHPLWPILISYFKFSARVAHIYIQSEFPGIAKFKLLSTLTKKFH